MSRRLCRAFGTLGNSRRSSLAWEFWRHSDTLKGEHVVKLTLRDRESVQEAVRRFRKLVERSGVKKEMRRREYYEKPSDQRRRARRRAERRARLARTPVT